MPAPREDSHILYLNRQIDELKRLADELDVYLHPFQPSLPWSVFEHLQRLGEQISHVKQTASLLENERQKSLALVDISQIVNSTLDLNEVLRIVMDTIIRLTGAERGFLMLRDKAGELVTQVARDWERESIHPSDFAISRTVINRVISLEQPVLTTNAQLDPRFEGQDSVVAHNLLSILCVPLKVKDELTGVIYADHRLRAGIFSERERDLLSAFANQAAVAIENARLFESTKKALEESLEKKHLEAQQRLFERMVSPAVIEQLDPDKIQLGGQRAEITVLFADLRGFTRFSEHQAPETLVAILNRYLAAAADAVLAHEGTIDKFMGDSIMAWFNAPIPQPDHVLRAVRAALDIQFTVSQLQQELPRVYRLSFGVGIHFGEAVLGLVGTEKRLDYTAVGDCVNSAKRIQENTTPGQILLSSEAYDHVAGKVIVNPVPPIHAKGKDRPLQVYEVVGLIE